MEIQGFAQTSLANESTDPLSEAQQDPDAIHPNPKVEDAGFIRQPISEERADPPRKGWRFWAIFPPLCLSQLLIALETSIPTASLPKISSDLDAGDNWVWIVNAYLLTK